jgi:alpha-tubulin suppressor-like RCC1 family protein
MAANNQFISNFRESPAENNVDVGVKFVTKDYLMDVYPYLNQSIGVTYPGLFVWGQNIAGIGQLGTNDTVHRSTPVQTAAGGTNWKQVSGGSVHTSAIKTDGTLWSCGYNFFGQLGTNDTVNKSTPVQTAVGDTNWKQVAGGGLHTAAVKSDGTLWTWGRNSDGQLGTNDRVHRSTPVQTAVGGTNWKQVSASATFTAAVKSDGTLWTWGNNLSGKLGTNDLIHRSTPTQVSGGGTNWKQVSLGYLASTAIKTDGTLWTWGYNFYGELGTNDTINKLTPVQTALGGTNWTQVSAGMNIFAAIKTDGTLWTCGYNYQGSLGIGVGGNRSTPVQTIDGGTNWKQVSCSNSKDFNKTSFMIAIKTNGTLWTWGYNPFGQLGTNDRTNRSTPVQTTEGGTNWKQVACGYGHSAAIKEMGDDF